MVGGFIIGLVVRGDQALVNVRGTGCEKNDVIAIRCEHLGHKLGLGDAIWWQGDKCYWTPVAATQGRAKDRDIELPKVGYSHAHAHVGASYVDYRT